MLKMDFKQGVVFMFVILVTPALALAHQPRMKENQLTVVLQPEISKAYYGQLAGEPDVYAIEATEPFNLYVNVLVPDIEGQKKDVSAVVIKDGKTEEPLAVLEGNNFIWTKFYGNKGSGAFYSNE